LTYNAQNLTTATSTTAIVGLPAAENNIVVDYRPATGQLYAPWIIKPNLFYQ
jgi:hypothetical protein